MSCPFCGNVNTADSSYCERCGVQLGSTSPKRLDLVTSIEICERCGAPMGSSGCTCAQVAGDVRAQEQPSGRKGATFGAVLMFVGMATTLLVRSLMPRVSEFEAAAANTALSSGGLMTMSSMRYLGMGAIALVVVGVVLLVVSALRGRPATTASQSGPTRF